MNAHERQMVALLTELRERHHAIAVKAEFEAEGARVEEMIRLRALGWRAGMALSIKVGGCDARTDLQQAATLGAATVIAPMVETPYALRKFLAAIRSVYPPDQREDVAFFVNIETATGCANLSAMLQVPEIDGLSGIVIGRSDLAASMDLGPEAVDSPVILEWAKGAAIKARAAGLDVLVGGGVTSRSREGFLAFPAGHLQGIETRKIVFRCPAALHNPNEAYVKAIEFERLWLLNERARREGLAVADEDRLRTLTARHGLPGLEDMPPAKTFGQPPSGFAIDAPT